MIEAHNLQASRNNNFSALNEAKRAEFADNPLHANINGLRTAYDANGQGYQKSDLLGGLQGNPSMQVPLSSVASCPYLVDFNSEQQKPERAEDGQIDLKSALN